MYCTGSTGTMSLSTIEFVSRNQSNTLKWLFLDLAVRVINALIFYALYVE